MAGRRQSTGASFVALLVPVHGSGVVERTMRRRSTVQTAAPTRVAGCAVRRQFCRWLVSVPFPLPPCNLHDAPHDRHRPSPLRPSPNDFSPRVPVHHCFLWGPEFQIPGSPGPTSCTGRRSPSPRARPLTVNELADRAGHHKFF